MNPNPNPELNSEQNPEAEAGEGFSIPTPLIVAVCVHLIVIGSGVAWSMNRWSARTEPRKYPAFREEPMKVLPQYNDPEIVADDELQRVLLKLQPKFRMQKPKINHIDHALRFWGVEATFADDEALSGTELRDMLLDDRRFEKAWGEKTPKLIEQAGRALRVRTQEGDYSAAHVDHTLATLAEVGTPLAFPVRVKDRELPLRLLLVSAARSFSLNQAEYEWSTLAFALYMPTAESWPTGEGQLVNFDRLARRIMRQSLPQGVCYGNHRMHALVMLLRVDEQSRILSDAGRTEIIEYLKKIVALYVANQSEQGWWDGTWAGTDVPLLPDSEGFRDPRTNKILATGHALEWWALAPQEIHPPREVMLKASRWLIKTIDELTERDVAVNYTYLSHAGRALSLWRGMFPAEAIKGARPANAAADKDAPAVKAPASKDAPKSGDQ